MNEQYLTARLSRAAREKGALLALLTLMHLCFIGGKLLLGKGRLGVSWSKGGRRHDADDAGQTNLF